MNSGRVVCRVPGGRVWLGCCGCFHSNNRGGGWATLALGCRLALGAATSTLPATRPTAFRPWACSFSGGSFSPLSPLGRGEKERSRVKRALVEDVARPQLEAAPGG